MSNPKKNGKAKWLAMLLCFALMAPSATEAQETNPLQEFIDSVTLANTVTAPDGSKKVKMLAKGAVPTLDLSKSAYSSYKNLTYTLEVTYSIKVVNGTIGAAEGFKGDRSGNAVAPLIRVKDGMTLYIDETAGASASNLTTDKCPATVELAGCSTLNSFGDITAPDNGTGVAVLLNSDCDSFQHEDGDVTGSVCTNSNTSSDNAFYCLDITAKAGSQVLLPIQMNNVATVSGLGFNVSLPQGVSVPYTEDSNGAKEVDIFLSDRVHSDKIIINSLVYYPEGQNTTDPHGLSGYKNELSWLCITGSTLIPLIEQGNGIVAYIPVIISNGMAGGVYQCQVTHAEIVDVSQENSLFLPLTSSTITVINDGTVPPGIAIDATNFPDENFRNYLLSQDYGADAWLAYSEIDAIKAINVSNKIISDLTGIAYFTELDTLDCNNNNLTALDVSALTKLRYLDCGSNLLTALNVTNNIALTYLNCGRIIKTEPGYDLVLGNNLNQIETLDLSKNTALETLGCSDNLLTSLDVRGLANLKVLDCSKNQLLYIDANASNQIESINCSGNTCMGNSRLPKYTNLTALFCDETALTGSIDLSNLTKLRYLSCGGNELMMIIVPEGFAVSHWSRVDQTMTSTLYALGNNRYALRVPEGFDLAHIDRIIINDFADELETDWANGGIRPFELVADYLVFSTAETPTSIKYNYSFSPINPNVYHTGSLTSIEVAVNINWVTNSDTLLEPEDITATSGGQVWLPIRYSIVNSKEFDLTLPDGVSVATNSDGTPICNFLETENDGETTIQMIKTEANIYHFSISCGKDFRINVVHNQKMNILLNVNHSVASGDYEIQLSNCYYKYYMVTSVALWSNKICADATCTLTVNDKLLGDVNDDGYVTLADAICEISWLLEQNPPVFDEAVADYNQDNVVSVSDAIAIIQYVVTANTNAINPDVPDEDVAKLIEEMSHLRSATNGFDLTLGDLRDYTAFTADITLGDDATLLSASLGTHSVATHSLGGGRYRIVAWSMDMAPIGAGAVLHCKTTGGKTSAVTLDHIRIVDMNTREHAASAVECTPTGIREVETGVAPTVRYRIDGARASGSQRGIYVEKGKKIISR